MSTETAAQSTTGTAKSAVKKTARKPAAGKSVTRKSGSRKTVAKKAGKKGLQAVFPGEFLTSSGAKIKSSSVLVQEMMKSMVYAQLGVYGKVYDGINARVVATRKEAPRQWNALVQRGEKVQKDLEKSGAEIKSDLKTGVTRLKGSYQESLDKVRNFASKAA